MRQQQHIGELGLPWLNTFCKAVFTSYHTAKYHLLCAKLAIKIK